MYSGEMFVTTGEHSTITLCTLSEWLPGLLPDLIVNEMVREFGLRLKKELVEL